MATQSMIIQCEDRVKHMAEVCRDIAGMVQYEGTSNGGMIPANRDCWGTLHVNLLAMVRQANKAIAELEKQGSFSR